jgi:muconolactone delta-isomerase
MFHIAGKECTVEFLVGFEINVPDGTLESEVTVREHAEASAAARLAAEGRLVRVWKRPLASGGTQVLGLYRADSQSQLEGWLAALPLQEWMTVTVTALEPHPNDPATVRPSSGLGDSDRGAQLPEPRLSLIYRLEATLGQPLDLGETAEGHRRIVPLTGGTFSGPELSGKLVPGASADWQRLLPDGTAIPDLRYTLQTDAGVPLYIRAQGVRHGSPEVLARLGRGENVDASEYTFRTSTQIETAAAELDWLNKGVFISVGGRQAAGVIYETYLVG